MDHFLQILLVDDDLDDRDIFIWVMRKIYSPSIIATAADGLEALDMLRREDYRPDLVFLDLNMPRMNGLDCLRTIRQDDKLNDLAVIIYSTSSNPHDITQSQAAGATDYIVKGNELATIKRELIQALKKLAPRLFPHEL